ncbi:hypothetical protein ACSBLW_02340 [Thioclava sp. FR2]|uniref:hypothetical protein n=1 Tax=Thioclava sp. FR2 TaxID=3445780 RepID=UPI003EBC6A6E
MPGADHDDIVRSYYRVRQTLGFLGLILPFLLVGGGMLSLGDVEPSISDYYHTILRDFLVGVITAIGIFLIAYPGHHRKSGEVFSDDRITTCAGIAALGVAFFPNEDRLKTLALETPTQLLLGHQWAAVAHYGSAIVFLFLLGMICLKKFSRTANTSRRLVYKWCGWTVLIMTAFVIIASWFKIRGPAVPQAFVNDWRLVLWFEALAIWAFAVAWLTKGRADHALTRLFGQAAPRKNGEEDKTPKG